MKYWTAAKKFALASGALIILFSVSPANAATSIRTQAAQQLRVATIGYRLARASSSLCRSPTEMSGLVMHELSQYPERDRPAISRAFSMETGIGVLGVVPGSVAEDAGFKVDDEILSINGQSVEDRDAFVARPAYRRMAGFQQKLEAALAQGTVRLTIRRNNIERQIELNGELGCGGRVNIRESGSFNAWSDGRYVMLTTAITSFTVSDDEISFVVAHEMAHNILGHNAGKGPSALLELLGFGTAKERSQESQADSFAIRMMAGAGYQGRSALALLSRINQKFWWENLSFSHPSFASRIRTVESTMIALSNREVELANGGGAAPSEPARPTGYLLAYSELGKMGTPTRTGNR